ncbi:MAG: CoA transferase, partial [Chloroflexi bacterium]|nr:CoA transferase [Chloroflexota bacterium]
IAPVYSLDEALEDPHNRHRGMLSSVAGPGGEEVAQIGVGPKLSETPGRPRTAGPSPGDQTDDVLASLGYEAERIAELRAAGVIS